MRFMRERSDFICLHGRHHISSSVLNAPYAKQFFTVNALRLVKAIKGVFRCVSGKGNDTCFRVTATCVATNYHVTQLILTPRPYDIPMFIDEMNVDSSFNIIKSYFTSDDSEQNKYATVEKYKYNGTDDSIAFQQHIKIDSLLGVHNDFDYPDYCMVSFKHQLKSYILFVPSIRIGQVGQGIATISFPGIEGTVSYGRIRVPFKLTDN
ncbi:unnamed protein product [Adineta steineri]|uniref:Uncharacterized protein n=1 Tax=Adineta steineri TaxID=433720 RepID=A0A819BZH8_9BILA|nr:unnamed protein product [Adineta steineri]CAF3810317.1 unnamed protein product [Adineta steineri]